MCILDVYREGHLTKYPFVDMLSRQTHAYLPKKKIYVKHIKNVLPLKKKHAKRK